MSSTWIQLVVTLAGFAVLVAGGVAYIRSALVRQRHEELADLAETRGERIRDLESHVERLSERVATLEGQIQAIQAIKAMEIASEVARLIHEERK